MTTARTRAPGLLLALAVSLPASLVWPALTAAQSGGTADERLQRLERALDNRGLLDLVRQVELLNEQVRQLRGELENQVFALEQLRKGQRESYVDIDNRLGALERGGAALAATAPGVNATLPPAPALGDPPLPTLAPTPGGSIAGAPAGDGIVVDIESPLPAGPLPAQAAIEGAVGNDDAAATSIAAATTTVSAIAPTPAVPALPAAAATPVVTPTLAPTPGNSDGPESEAAYRDAFGMLKAGQYEDSIAAFDSYLEAYPGSQYADNAQYWLGEAYYVMRQFEPAIEQYQRLIQNHPASKKQSHAMLKIAYSYDELGQGDQARAVLNDLKARFPGSAAARLADERLQRLRAAAP